MRSWRERTMANSAATKNPFTRTSTNTNRRSTTSVTGASPWVYGPGAVTRDSEGGRRRSSPTSQGYQWPPWSPGRDAVMLTKVSEQDQAPYLEALIAYMEREPGRFHIPGHKGGPGAAPALIHAIGERAVAFDIPALIEGIDVGSDPTPFEHAQRLAAEAWGARRSWFLINGASQGNHAACVTLRHMGRRVVVQRNVHSSTIDGLVIAGLEPTFVAPELDPELHVAHCMTPDALERALTATPEAV